jgi:hypothetical protein
MHERIFSSEQEQNISKKITSNEEDMRTGRSDTLPIDRRPTPVDLHGLEPGLTDDQLLVWIGKGTDIHEEILRDGNSPESREAYKKLNEAYQDAKFFLKTTLKYEPGEIQVTHPGKLEKAEDLIALLRNIKSIKGETGGLDQSIKYCRLIKTSLAVFETKKHDAELLEGITEHFEKSLISPDGKNTPLRSMGYKDEGIQFMVSDPQDPEGGVIDAVLFSRSKKFAGTVLRYLNRPESNAKIALRDGIGVRIIIDKDQAMKLIPVLLQWLTSKMGVINPEIENSSYLAPKQMNTLTQQLSEKFPDGGFSFVADHPDATSSGNFKVLKLKGIMNFSDKDASIVLENHEHKGAGAKHLTEISAHARVFEIQFVVSGNKNEEDEGNHYVYDAKKFVTARTRLDGWCPKKALEAFVEEAAQKSGISSAKIKHFLLGGDKAPIVEIEKNGRLSYVAFSTYERWKRLGHISNEHFAEIEAARIKGREKYKKTKS